jgi:hypothetical protein
VEHVSCRNQYVARIDGQLDQHLVDVAYYQQRPTPRVWLGFSSELAVIDRWFFGAGTGLWVSGLGGAGKSSLVSVWIAALRMIGYERPLNVSIRQWDFYETPDPTAAFSRIHPWVNSSGLGIQLLFLDGLDELTDPPVREICELVTRYPGLKVLVTSRQSMPEEYSTAFYGLSLGSLDREQSELLASHLGFDQHVTEKLFNLLHGHPLSISLAASLVENGYDVQDIVRTIERSPN